MSFKKRPQINLQFILASKCGDRIGGMEMMAVNLLHRLDHEKYNTSLISLHQDEGVISRIDRSLVSVEIIKKKNGLDPILVPRLALHFLKTRPDLIHTLNEGALIYAFPAAKLARVPVIIHGEHGRLPINERPLLKAVRIRMTKMADHTIVVSEELRKLLVHDEAIPEEKVTVVINGVDLRPFDQKMDRDDLRKALGIAPDEWVVGTVGSLTPQKNQALLISAAAKVPGIKVLIAGAGPLKDQLNDLIKRLKVADRVHCIGQRADVPQFLTALDLFALSSITEGTSLALLEAMAARLPIVATAVGGNGAVIVDGESGLLVPSDDVDVLAAKLMWCRSHQVRCRKLGLAGRGRVEEQYSLNRTVEAYDAIFDKALA